MDQPNGYAYEHVERWKTASAIHMYFASEEVEDAIRENRGSRSCIRGRMSR